jgi:acetoin utilization deacetylase AcuC-like enzyme
MTPEAARRVGFFFHPACLSHDPGPGHPERPQRLAAILEHLRAVGLWDQLSHLEPDAASRETIALVHPAAYVEAIERACRDGPTALDPDTTASSGSWEAARRAVGAVTQAIDHVVGGQLDAAFCAVRPPGHHALADRAMGFCLFNNVAIGARYAQQRHGLSRILIVDWDVHHGNGTQAIFDDDPSVLYVSTHQYPFYPGTGAPEERGRGAGTGFTVNVPLRAGAGDAELIRAVREQLIPTAEAFRPELVLISAGFDAHRDDPLAGLSVTEAGYAELTRLVRELANRHSRGRIVSVLEGGYDLVALGNSVETHLRVLLSEEHAAPAATPRRRDQRAE